MVMYVVSVVLSMASSKPLVLRLCASPQLTVVRFVASQHDSALFPPPPLRGRTLILLNMDDMLIAEDDSDYIAFVKSCLSEQFHMSDLDPLTYFLGIEVTSTPDGYYLSQRKYIYDLLNHGGLTDHHSMDTPMELHTSLRDTDGVPLEDPTCYRHLVGSPVYLSITRPNVSYVVHILSQFMSTIVISFMFFDIFMALSIDTCSSPAPAHFSFTLTLMLLGVLILRTSSLSLLIVSSLVHP
jgi:hypothetical protein